MQQARPTEQRWELGETGATRTDQRPHRRGTVTRDVHGRRAAGGMHPEAGLGFHHGNPAVRGELVPE